MFSTRDIRAIYLFQFKKGLNAAQATREINQVCGENTCSERTVRRWFTNFRQGNFDLQNEPRGRPPPRIDDTQLLREVERDPATTVRRLAETFQVSPDTISRHLARLGKVKKLDRWVPHILTEANKLQRLEIASSLINRNKNSPFLHRLVTCDEKWILYDNRKRSGQWLGRDEAPRHHARAPLHPRKVMVIVWWTSKGVIHYSFLPPGETITAESYCREIERMHEKLRVLQPALVNRYGPILLHDNARPHVSHKTTQKLLELGYEILPHPPYSPDLSPTDFHFFRSLDHCLRNKCFPNRDVVISAFEEFVRDKNQDFFKNGIFVLPQRWQKTVDVNGDYFSG